MWFQNQSQSLQSETPHLYSSEYFTTYAANSDISQMPSEQASTSKYPNYLQNQWSAVNSSHVSVASGSYQQFPPPHYSGSEESTQNPHIPDPEINLDPAKGEFEKECNNFIYHCRTLSSKKESRSRSRSNSISSSSSVFSEERSRSPSTKRHKSYSQERSPKRLRSSSSSRHHKVKKSKKKKVNVKDRSVSPAKSRDHHSRQASSWFSSDSDTESNKYIKLYKSIEKTALKSVNKEISRLFERSLTKEETWKCLRNLHEREFAEYKKNPEFHPLYSLEKIRWDSHMKNKGFDLHHEAVEREWNRYFNILLEKKCIESWRKKEKKLLKKLENSKKFKSSGKTNSYSSTLKSDSKHRSSSFSKDKEADRRYPEDRSSRKRSSSPSSREKKYPRDHHRGSNTRKRDRSIEKNYKSSKHSSETKTVSRNREENKALIKHPLRVKKSPQKVERISEKSRSSHLSNKDQISSRSGNNSKGSSLKQNSSQKKCEDIKRVDKIVSNYVKKEPLEADTKHSISVKNRLTFISPTKPSVKDRLYIPWETKKEQLIGNLVTSTAAETIPSPSSIRVEVQNNRKKYGSNERVIVLKKSNDDLTERDNNMLFSNSKERDSKYTINDLEEPSDETVKISDNKNVTSNNDMDGELANYSPHMNMFSVLKQMKDKFGSFAESISEMYITMSELNKEGKNLINHVDSDAETLLLLIKDKINRFMSDSKISLIQKAIYFETLTNLSSFLTEVKEKERALAEEKEKALAEEKEKALAEEKEKALAEEKEKALAEKAAEKKLNLVKEIDTESLAKAVAGKDCKEIINFIKEYFQFRKLDFEREDIMSIYMDVKKHQSTLVTHKKVEEQSSMKNKFEKQHNEKKDQTVVSQSPKNNPSKHSTANMDSRKENLPSTKSRITSPKRLSKTDVDKKTVNSKFDKKIVRDDPKTDSKSKTSFVRGNIKTDSNTKTSFVKSTNCSFPSQSIKNEHTFKMQLKKSCPSSVCNVNVLQDKSMVRGKTSPSDSDHEDKSSVFSIPHIRSIGQLVQLSFGEQINIYKKFSKYDKDTQLLLSKYLKHIAVTNKQAGDVLTKCKK